MNLPKKLTSRYFRKEYILNIILNTTILLILNGLLIIVFRNCWSLNKDYQEQSLSIITMLFILGLFLFLRFLSYKGHRLISAHILISLLYFLATYLAYRWGVDLPAGILFYVLIIVISGILIGSKMSFVNTILIVSTISILRYLNYQELITSDRSWIIQPWGKSDITMVAILFLIIATVLWLFNRELEKSEKELEQERDLLELRVEEKTKELKATQVKEIEQIYRLAEFGKIAGGLFHDLVNPLTAITLNINKIKIDNERSDNFEKIKNEINQTIKASEKMKDFILSVRRQLSFKEEKIRFSINQEIEEAIEILNYPLKENHFNIIFEANSNIFIFGNPIKFNQLITNLISNAIDAKDSLKEENQIKINLQENNQEIIIKIRDNGQGISEKIIKKIFDPFFSTKNHNQNLGLGLSIIKEIIQDSYQGKINVWSKNNVYTLFIITIPKYEPINQNCLKSI